ncbi:hypothetical protein KW805_04140 [Candidatus Pacearchaeota archaeon]|nr:hypothetical protein [Candidatus Pacearchaeota archaeon]
MLPRTHIILGAAFSILLWIINPNIYWPYLALTFLASVFIDFDHYVASVMKTRKLSLMHSFDYHARLNKVKDAEKKRGIRTRGDFHLFHTVEFHALIGILGIFFAPFFYIFIGMVFHSLLDLISLVYKDVVYVREYFFFSWLWNKF